MNPIRLLSQLLNAVSIVALCLCGLTVAGTANADDDPSEDPNLTFCAGCTLPNNTPCAAWGIATCKTFAACTTCFCVYDPAGPGFTCL